MKRVVCSLLIVLIAYSGRADKKPSNVTVVPLPPIWYSPGDWESNPVLRLKIVRLERELFESRSNIAKLEAALESQRAVSRAILAKWEREQSKGKIMHKQNKALLVRIDDLEAAIESQREVESVDKALLVKISKLEAALEPQRAAIKSLKNVHRVYEVAIDAQKVTIESLLNLCHLYEAKIESQRAAIENCGF